jgi:glycerophosphoryl diester phosphodiesterase
MDWSSTGIGLRIGGHRGAPDVAPENTLASFEAAREVGVEYLENDIHRSADGALVVIHDPTLERTTNGTGPVADRTLDELRALDAGGWFGAGFRGQRIQTLDEFLEWIEGCAPLGAVIESKADGTGAEIANAIASSSARTNLSICSFKARELAAAKAAVPDVRCILLFQKQAVPDPIARIRACGADGADIPWQWLAADLVAEMHEAGLRVGGGTANDAASVEKLIGLGADFVDSDAPRVAVAARNARGQAV